MMMKTLPLPAAAALLLFTIAPSTTLVVSGFSAAASSTCTRQTEWQDDLMQNHAQPLVPTPFSQALETLQRDGVVRIDGRSVDPDLCSALRSKILEETSQSPSTSMDIMDKKYVPGTRLRFDVAMDLAFGGDVRHDLLLPLYNNCPELPPVLRSAASKLEPLLVAAADSLLQRLYGSSASASELEGGSTSNLEVVEVGSLLVRPGSGHQAMHGDYRRFHNGHNPQQQQQAEEEPMANTQARMETLPPRLVCFVALQDVPTNQHGATGFVTGTHTSEAHELVYGTGQGITAKQDDPQKIEVANRNRQAILDLSMQQASGVRMTEGMGRGDMLVYDASVLHWGGANSVPHNDRAMLYFGVALPGAAAMLSGKPSKVMESFEIVPPLLLQDAIALPEQEQ
jgi:hypothetical protein